MKRLASAYHIFVFILLMEAGLPIWREIQGYSIDSIEGDPIYRNVLLVAYLLPIIPLLLAPHKILNIVKKKPLVWLMILLATVSILWSSMPTVSFRRAGAIILITLYATSLYTQYTFEEFLNLLGKALLIIAFSSVLLALVKPELGRMLAANKESWRGVFGHKNGLGFISAISILVFGNLYHLYRKNFRRKIIWMIGIALSALCLVKSNSLTGMLVFFVLVAVLFILKIAHSWNKVFLVFLIFFLIVFGTIGALIFQNSNLILSAMGKDVTLSGRITLWRTLIPMGLKRFLGYGYSAFWLGWNGPSARIWSIFWWHPYHSHNGFIDMWLELGWLGLLSSFILLFGNLFGNLWGAIIGDQEKRFWFLLFLCLLVVNFSESVIMRVNSIYWVLIVFAYFSFQKEKSPAQVTAAS